VGRDVDDHTVSRGRHRWQKSGREINQCAAIQLDLRGIGVGILADELPVQTDAGIVDQDVDPPPEVTDLGCEVRR
jgi:hypothetical protein